MTEAVKDKAPLATAKDVIELARREGLKIVDFKFVDLPGTWQHFSATIDQLTPELFTGGIGFDGSSVRGFQSIHESDMLLMPDPATALVDPVCAVPTLSLVCDVVDPLTKQPYTRDPRHIARKAEAYLRATGIADTSFWGPEAEFFVFDSVSYEQTQHSAHYALESSEGIWNSGRPGPGHLPRWKEGYFPVSPGDSLLLYKYIVKNAARAHGKTATFMPKPIWGDNGSGMHVHQSLWKAGETLMADPAGYAGLSPLAKHYIGGLLRHAPALLALVAPTVNSYHRLVPGFEAPVNIAYSRRNRSAAVRIPMYSDDPRAKRIEFRCPDPSCNPYLAFAALLMAGLDGVQNEIDPGEPADYDLFERNGHGPVKQVPGSLPEALAALDADHEFLLRGGVFTTDVLAAWVEMKRTREIDPIRLRPHPYEFYLYYDA